MWSTRGMRNPPWKTRTKKSSGRERSKEREGFDEAPVIKSITYQVEFHECHTAYSSTRVEERFFPIQHATVRRALPVPCKQLRSRGEINEMKWKYYDEWWWWRRDEVNDFIDSFNSFHSILVWLVSKFYVRVVRRQAARSQDLRIRKSELCIFFFWKRENIIPQWGRGGSS